MVGFYLRQFFHHWRCRCSLSSSEMYCCAGGSAGTVVTVPSQCRGLAVTPVCSCVSDVLLGACRVDVGFGRREQILSEHRLLYRRDSDATDAKTSTPCRLWHRIGRAPRLPSGCGVRFGLLQTQHSSSAQAAGTPMFLLLVPSPFPFCFSCFPSVDIPPNTTRTDFPFVRVFSWELPRLDL